MTTTALGNAAELEALALLRDADCKLITSNFHSRFGEIDLIVMDDSTLVFVEVRYRRESSRGSGAETVTHQKRKRIIRTAEYFLLQNKQYRQQACRFDVISMGTATQWIKRAFTLDT